MSPHAVAPTPRHYTSAIGISLVLTLAAWTSAWPQDVRLQVAVETGQLSVNLREAPVREVLAAIGRQAGLRVRMEAGDARRVTAQFTAMALEPGLRRLLRAAALSSALEYTRAPGAAPTLSAVRVFGAAHDPAHDRPSPDTLAQAEAPERVAHALPAAEPPEAPEASDAEPLELDPEAPDASASDLTHDWQD
jgi:hypothetical protein